MSEHRAPAGLAAGARDRHHSLGPFTTIRLRPGPGTAPGPCCAIAMGPEGIEPSPPLPGSGF